MSDENRWERLEAIVRRVLREELAALGKKKQVGFTGGRFTGITEEQMCAWTEAYPNLDVDGELKKAAAWVVSNPLLAPKSQWGRFINTWLTKNHNQRSLHSIPTGQQSQPRVCAYCGEAATGSANGYQHCRAHSQDAVYNRTPKAA